jgi:hypothetical protein
MTAAWRSAHDTEILPRECSLHFNAISGVLIRSMLVCRNILSNQGMFDQQGRWAQLTFSSQRVLRLHCCIVYRDIARHVALCQDGAGLHRAGDAF